MVDYLWKKMVLVQLIELNVHKGCYSYLDFSDHCSHLKCYSHNVSVYAIFNLPQVYPVELGNPSVELVNFERNPLFSPHDVTNKILGKIQL